MLGKNPSPPSSLLKGRWGGGGGCEADHFSPFNAEVNAGSNTFTPFMCLHGLQYGNCAANHFAAVHPDVVYHIDTDIRTAVSHKNCLYFRQYMLHV